MTDYTDRCAAVKAAVQDHARDLEADLGKIARNCGHNVNWNDVQPIGDPGRNVAEYEETKGWYPVDDSRLRSYQNVVSAATDFLGSSVPLTGPEKAARDDCIILITAIEQIKTHGDAVALVASFE